jgi:hypothetical protein
MTYFIIIDILIMTYLFEYIYIRFLNKTIGQT